MVENASKLLAATSGDIAASEGTTSPLVETDHLEAMATLRENQADYLFLEWLLGLLNSSFFSPSFFYLALCFPRCFA